MFSDSYPAIQNDFSAFQITCFTGWSLFHISTVQGDLPLETSLYTDHTWIHSSPQELDSGISYQHLFTHSQTSGHLKKPVLFSSYILSTYTNQHHIGLPHIHEQCHVLIVTTLIPPDLTLSIWLYDHINLMLCHTKPVRIVYIFIIC